MSRIHSEIIISLAWTPQPALELSPTYGPWVASLTRPSPGIVLGYAYVLGAITHITETTPNVPTPQAVKELLDSYSDTSPSFQVPLGLDAQHAPETLVAFLAHGGTIKMVIESVVDLAEAAYATRYPLLVTRDEWLAGMDDQMPLGLPYEWLLPYACEICDSRFDKLRAALFAEMNGFHAPGLDG